MMPTADQMEQVKMAQRAQLKLAQGFQMYTYFIATGSRIEEAFTKMEAAMEAWKDYEDRHTIEMPGGSDVMSILGKFGEMADRLGKQAQEPEDDYQANGGSPIDPEDDLALQRMEQTAWDEYQASKRILNTIAVDSPDRQHFERMTLETDRRWRSFGTAHLRLQLAQLTPAAHPPAMEPSNQANGGLSTEKENL